MERWIKKAGVPRKIPDAELQGAYWRIRYWINNPLRAIR